MGRIRAGSAPGQHLCFLKPERLSDNATEKTIVDRCLPRPPNESRKTHTTVRKSRHELLSRRIDLPPDRVVRAVEAPSEAALTVICRAAGLNVNSFSAILRMRRRHLPSDVSPAEVLGAFIETSLGTARQVVSMLKLHDVVELPE